MFQKLVLSVVLACAMSVVAFFLIIKVIDFNEYKPKIQKSIKMSTGYDVLIKGDVALSLSPVGVSVFDVELINPQYRSETPFASLGSLSIAVEIVPLFNKEIKVKYIEIDRLHVSMEKTKDGRLNYELLSASKAAGDRKAKEAKESKENNASSVEAFHFPLVNIKKIKFNDAALSYHDLGTQTKIQAEHLTIDVRDIQYDASKNSKLQALSFKLDASIDKLIYDAFTLQGVVLNAQMKEANIMMDAVSYTLFDGMFQGNGTLDLSGKNPKVSIKQKVSDLKLVGLSKALWKKSYLEGNANGELKLAFSLADASMFKNTLNGFVHLDGKNITLKGYDLDTIVGSLKDPQNLNIVQLINGNLGIVEGGSSLLSHVVVHTDIGYSKVSLSDVALSSAKYRIAAKGALNIVEEKFLDVVLAILDAKGCSTFSQTIVGSFNKPALKVDETTIAVIANTALSLFGKTKKVAPETVKDNADCTPFYEGLVKHPEIK
jgi:AsmA protein